MKTKKKVTKIIVNGGTYKAIFLGDKNLLEGRKIYFEEVLKVLGEVKASNLWENHSDDMAMFVLMLLGYEIEEIRLQTAESYEGYCAKNKTIQQTLEYLQKEIGCFIEI